MPSSELTQNRVVQAMTLNLMQWEVFEFDRLLTDDLRGACIAHSKIAKYMQSFGRRNWTKGAVGKHKRALEVAVKIVTEPTEIWDVDWICMVQDRIGGGLLWTR